MQPKHPNRFTRLIFLTILLTSHCGFALASPETEIEFQNSIVGAWIGDVTVLEPAGTESFATLLTLHSDKTVLETKMLLTAYSPLGPLLATPGHGAWRKIGPRTYAISFKFYVQGGQGNPYYEGALVGINNINYTATLDESGKALEATWTSALTDPDGTRLFGGSGTFSGKRIEVEQE